MKPIAQTLSIRADRQRAARAAATGVCLRWLRAWMWWLGVAVWRWRLACVFGAHCFSPQPSMRDGACVGDRGITCRARAVPGTRTRDAFVVVRQTVYSSGWACG